MQSTARETKAVSRILDRSKEVAAPGDILDWTERNEDAAIQATLIPCVATAPEPGWRISVPKEARQLAADPEASCLFILTVAGFVELWFPETLRREVSKSISDILP